MNLRSAGSDPFQLNNWVTLSTTTAFLDQDKDGEQATKLWQSDDTEVCAMHIFYTVDVGDGNPSDNYWLNDCAYDSWEERFPELAKASEML